MSLLRLIEVAGRSMARSDRVAAMAGCLEEEPGFLGVFTRGEPLGEIQVNLNPQVSSLKEAEVIAVLEAELDPTQPASGGPGVPRQITVDESLMKAGKGFTAILLWDDHEETKDATGPQLLGGLLLDSEAELLASPELYSLLQILQLALSRERYASRMEDFRAGLELINALQPPKLSRGEEFLITRSLSQFRRVIPFDAVALATAEEEETFQVRYLFQDACPPRLVQDVKREMREVLGIPKGASLNEVFENEAMGGPTPQGERMESLLILPVLGQNGEDCGRIGFFSCAAGFFTTHHLRLLSLLAPTIGAALQALRGLEGLQTRANALQDERNRVDAQLGLAKRLQSQLLSSCPPPPEGLGVAQRSEMSAAIGGDFYAARPVGRHRYAVAIADVSGKGLPAGIVMAHTLGALSASWDTNPDPKHVIRRLNRVVLDSTDDYTFVTFLVLLVDLKREEIVLSSAGHEPLLKINEHGDIQEFTTGDPPLGVVSGHEFGEAVLPFRPGDRILAFTDGITEALAPDGERFGRSRLDEVLRASKPGVETLLEEVFGAVDAFQKEAPAADDRTAVALGRRP